MENRKTIHNEKISITRVALMLNIAPLTIKRWYKWAMNVGETKEKVGLPEYTTDNRGTWFFTLEQVNQLQKFRQNLKWGQMAEFNSKYYWSKKKGEKMNKVEEENLIKTIDDLAKNKAEKTKLEGSIKKASDFVKKKFEELDIEDFSTDNFRAYLQYSNKIDMDEDKIIQILKENCKKDDYEKVIRTKEYVDFEALESLIYNEGIPAEKLESAQTIKTTVSLYTKPVKKEKKDE